MAKKKKKKGKKMNLREKYRFICQRCGYRWNGDHCPKCGFGDHPQLKRKKAKN